MSPARDWRTKAEQATVLVHDVWYRSPLWGDDHHLGRDQAFVDEGLAWCGRALLLALEGWGDQDVNDPESLAGLWVTNRAAAKCATCARREKEWNAHIKTRA